jgi:hypothetical protein
MNIILTRRATRATSCGLSAVSSLNALTMRRDAIRACMTAFDEARKNNESFPSGLTAVLMALAHNCTTMFRYFAVAWVVLLFFAAPMMTSVKPGPLVTIRGPGSATSGEKAARRARRLWWRVGEGHGFLRTVRLTTG